MATLYAYPELLTVEEFLAIDFGERKAELDEGVIRMMAGGTFRHARISANIMRALGNRLVGTGCTPYGSDAGTRTRPRSLRYPDVSVYCGREAERDDQSFASDPVILFEVLSAGTARTDLEVKLPEYQALPSVDTVVFVDIASERVRVVQRIGPEEWTDVEHRGPFDVPLPALNLTILHAEIFAGD